MPFCKAKWKAKKQKLKLKGEAVGLSICKSIDLQIDTNHTYTPSITGCVSVICVKEYNQKSRDGARLFLAKPSI